MKKSYAIITALFGTVLCLSGLVSLIAIGKAGNFDILCQKTVQDIIAVSLGGLIGLFGWEQQLEASNR